MTKRIGRIVMAGLLIAGLPAGLSAQARKGGSQAIEIGVDGGFSFGLNTPSTVTFSLPFSNLRAAFPINDRWSLEPSVGFTYLHVGSTAFTTSSSTSALSLLLGAPYLLNGATHHKGLYIRPFAGLTSFSITGAPSTNSFVLGGGIGYRMAATDRMSWRMEANFNHGFGGGDPSALDLLFGLSFFTK